MKLTSKLTSRHVAWLTVLILALQCALLVKMLSTGEGAASTATMTAPPALKRH